MRFRENAIIAARIPACTRAWISPALLFSMHACRHAVIVDVMHQHNNVDTCMHA